MNATRDPDASERIVLARMAHVDTIHRLITYYAERNRMLFRSLESLYETVRNFRVYVDGGEQVLGCCALEVFWRDLAEIKSLAVDPTHQKRGVGRSLVVDALSQASQLGIRNVFALTYEPAFFEKLGFHQVSKESLPHKVWTDCIRCPMRNDCREVPLLYELTERDG